MPPRHSWLIGFVLTLNASIGSGILVIPWAFAKGGVALGTGLAALSTVVVLVLAFQMMEVMSRTEAYVRRRERKGGEADETMELQGDWETPCITDRKFDVTEMVRLLYGEKLRTVYTICYAVFTYIGGMALSSIFATTLTEFIPVHSCHVYSDGLHGSCRLLFTAYLGLFAGMMMYFSWRGYEGQVAMQVVTAGVRVTVVGGMLATSAVAIGTESYLEGDEHNPVSFPHIFRPLYSGVIFPIFFLACSFHSAIPNIAQLLAHRPSSLPRALSVAIGTCFGMYVAVGWLVPLAAGEVSKLASLNWKEYSAGYDRDEKPWWTYLLLFPIVLFPAFEATSMFPLYAVTLSDNLISLQYGHSYEGQLSPVPPTQAALLLYRAAAVLPPIFLTAVVYDIVSATPRASFWT